MLAASVAAVALLAIVAGGTVGRQVLVSFGGDPREPTTIGGAVVTPTPTVVVADGAPVVVTPSTQQPTPTPAATAQPTPVPTPQPTARPSPAPTPPPATPAPTAVPTPTPAVAAAPPQAVEAVAPATRGPAETVVRWYELVAAGAFDQAYALWSDRMRAGFERSVNLDERWADTASITVNEVYVAEQIGDTAKVQIDFVEVKDSGASRQFIGWWELVLVDGRWLLDWPHF